MKFDTNPILPALARKGMLGIGIPAREGGSGGDLADLFDAVARTARDSVATARMFAVQRQFAEVLRRSENVGLAEYRLGYVLEGLISGACRGPFDFSAESDGSCLPGERGLARGLLQ